MRPVQAGERVIRQTGVLTGAEPEKPQKLSGTVVWVHPRGRYHVVEFETEGGAVRESFLGAAVEQRREELEWPPTRRQSSGAWGEERIG